MEKNNIITFMRFESAGEAEIMKALLEAGGIRSNIENDMAVSIQPYLVTTDPIRLVINSDDLEKANEMINAKFDEKEFEAEVNNSKE